MTQPAVRAGFLTVPTPDGDVEVRVVGAGTPVTVFAHGIAASIDEMRAVASGVPGCRVFFHFRGHGASVDLGTPWTYDSLAGQLRAVSDHVGATQALGVSMGAGALTRMVADQPDRFARVVFFLPAVIDRMRSEASGERLAALSRAVDAHDVEALSALLLDEQAGELRDSPTVRGWARGQAERLLGPGLRAAVRQLPGEVAIADRSRLAAVRCPCLVVAQEGDRAHPAELARELAAALPDARLEVLPASAMWLQRGRVREIVSGFLRGGSDA